MSKPQDIKVGEIDPVTGVRVKQLIMWSETFVVYLGEDLFTYWWLSDHPSTIIEFGKVLARVASLESRPIGHLAPDRALAFRSLVAESVARALGDNSYQGAEAALNEAEQYYNARSAEVARGWLLACGLIGVFGGIVYLGVAYAVMPAGGPTWVGAIPMIVALGCGAIGASLSLISRVGKLAVDPAAGFPLHCLESVARVAAGIVGGGLAYLAIKAQLVATGLVGTGSTEWAVVMLFCTVAGLSERFVPQLVDQIESGHGAGAPGAGKKE